MRAFGIIAVLECVRNRMYCNFERGVTTWLYIDEVQSLFGHPAIISYFSKFWAEGRKFNLICTGITQNSVYMLEHVEARNMVLNSDFILLHKQSPVDRKAWVELLDLSAQEAGYIDESVKAGEGLLIAGGARIPIKDDFPKGALYDLFNTKPEEIAALKRASGFAENARKRAVAADSLLGRPGDGAPARVVATATFIKNAGVPWEGTAAELAVAIGCPAGEAAILGRELSKHESYLNGLGITVARRHTRSGTVIALDPEGGRSGE